MALANPPSIPLPTWAPLYLDTGLDAQTFPVILARILASLAAAGYAIEEGDRLFDWIVPVPTELASWPIRADTVRRSVFLDTSWDGFLDHLGVLVGLQRGGLQLALGSELLTGAPGTTIQKGTIVGTEATATQPAILFQTTAAATIPAGGSIAVPIVALVAGSLGNVAAGALSVLLTSTPGVTAVTNPARTQSGQSVQADGSYQPALIQQAAAIVGTGTMDDYRRWLSVNWRTWQGGQNPIGTLALYPLWQGEQTVLVEFLEPDGSIPLSGRVTTVQAFLSATVPPFQNPTVLAPTAVNLDYRVPGLQIDPSADGAVVQAAITAAIAASLAAAGIGGVLRIHLLEGAVAAIPGLLNFGDITVAITPSSDFLRQDILLEQTQVAVLHSVTFPSGLLLPAERP